MYKAQQEEEAKQEQPNTAKDTDDNIVDADFEEVKEKK